MSFGLPGPARLSGVKAGISVVLALGCLLVVVAGALASPIRTSSAPPQPPPLSAHRGAAVVSASLGSYEWGEVISDAGYPLPIHKRLPVSPGDRVSLRIGAPAARVMVSLLHVTGEEPIGHVAGDVLAQLRSRPISPSRGRWLTKLPRRLKSGNVLDISVRYAKGRGDADFWVGLRPRRADHARRAGIRGRVHGKGGHDWSVLQNKSFVVVSVRDRSGPKPPIARPMSVDVSFTLVGLRRALSWQANCNYFNYRIRSASRRLVTTHGINTLVACPGRRSREDGWLDGFFRANPRWRLWSGHLKLVAGNRVVRLQQRPSRPRAARPTQARW